MFFFLNKGEKTGCANNILQTHNCDAQTRHKDGDEQSLANPGSMYSLEQFVPNFGM